MLKVILWNWFPFVESVQVYLNIFLLKPFIQALISFTDFNECSDSPCENNGTCINNEGSFICDCENGWKGKLCHIGCV